jgi:hypothetical protein
MTTTNLFQNLRSLVIGGTDGRWNYKDRLSFGEICNGIESFVFTFEGDYTSWKTVKEEDLSSYDIVFANLNNGRELQRKNNGKELPLHRDFLKNRNFTAKWVVIIEGDAYDYIIPDESIRFVLQNADLVIVINKHTESFFQALTKTACFYIGVPYPLSGIQKFTIPFEERLEQILLCSDPLLRNTDYLAAAQLDLPMFCFAQTYSRNFRGIKRNFVENKSLFDKYILVDRINSYYKSPAITVDEQQSINMIFPKIASKKYWINLDTRYTWGRYVLDAASLGIPIITTASTGHGETLFPLTTLKNGFDIDGAVKLGKKLISDSGFYKEVSLYSQEQIKQYGLDSIRSKILSLLSINYV